MSWQELCQQKWMTVEQAASHIKSGDRTVVAHATGEPSALIDAMVKSVDAYRNVEIAHTVAMGKGEYCLSEYTENFRHSSLFLGASTRNAIAKGCGDLTPVYFSQIPDLPCEELRPNVALLHLSPPGEHGYCNYGVSVGHTKFAAEIVDLRIVQINPNMPRTLDDSLIHVSEPDRIVEVDDPIIEPGQAKIGETKCVIGERCASLIQDGDCLQLGINAIPDAALLLPREKKDLGIHSETFSDGMIEPIEAGMITNRRKILYKGQCVVTLLMGGKRLYDYVNNNPSVVIYPVDYVSNPAAIAKSDNLVSINSCIQADLMGQVVSDSIDPRQFSGAGGQVDLMRGANLSRGGKSIMAIPSSLVKKDGTCVSEIAVQIDAGAAMTTFHYDVNHIVTEFGVIKLKSKILCDRAKTLIEIAHPDFREEPMEESHRRFRV